MALFIAASLQLLQSVHYCIWHELCLSASCWNNSFFFESNVVSSIAAVTLTGIIWTRYSTQITPINYNLMTVNAFMALTGMYQLSRKIR